jgi:hypothetical protein
MRKRDAFKYLLAGRGAPVGVQTAISAFRRLPFVVRAATPLLWWLMPDGTPPYKFSKVEAAYQPYPQGEQQCSNCRSAYQHVTSGHCICDQMRGTILPEAWCRVWRPPFQPGFYVRYQER